MHKNISLDIFLNEGFDQTLVSVGKAPHCFFYENQVCIKLTNEPPEGLKPNLLKAMIPFTDEFFEGCSKPGELRYSNQLPPAGLELKLSLGQFCSVHALFLPRDYTGTKEVWTSGLFYTAMNINVLVIGFWSYFQFSRGIPDEIFLTK